MAMTTSMQTIVASPFISSYGRSNKLNQFTPAGILYRPQTKSNVQVQCMSKEPQDTTISSPKVSTKFNDLFAFNGPVPERINGRLAMIGFVAAIAVELSNGEDLFAQISNGGIPWFLVTSVVLTSASLVPMLKGVSAESKSEEIFSSDAEIWNGRFAMIGLVALALTEYVRGGTLV